MLAARGLSKAYRGTTVVHDVQLELEPGRVVGLVGANGAGKTTTIKMLAGLVEPTGGSAELDGQPTLEPDARRRIGYLPEESPLYDEQTPLAYLSFFADLYGVGRSEGRERARELLDRLALAEEARSREIGKLSKGMRRKVAIARTLLHDPDVLLLDEPTSGLDPVTARELARFITELRGEGRAILLSAHDLQQVEELCDEVIVMHGGEIAVRGTLQELRTQVGEASYVLRATAGFPGSRKAGTVHEAQLETWADVEQALSSVHEAGGDVVEVESVLPGLEDVLHGIMEA